MKIQIKILICFMLLATSALKADCVDNIAKTSGPFDTNSLRGQIIDQSTGLVWYVCLLGESLEDGVCTGDAYIGSWLGALELVESFNFADSNQWRLPNIKELQSLVEYSCSEPIFEEGLFLTQMQSPLWSSTPELVEEGEFNRKAYVLTSRGTTVSDQKDEEFYAIVVRNL